MKDTIKDANFPTTSEGRVYHLGLKYGEIANRIITVGDPSRAKTIAQYLDRRPQTAPMDLLDSTSDSSSGDKVVPGPLFTLLSERGFLTITGTYNGVPISVVAIGMGAPNMDFFIRECREILEGEMIIIRLGSCGGIAEELRVGSLAVPRSSISISRNYDYDYTQDSQKDVLLTAYRFSKPASADQDLHAHLNKSLQLLLPHVNTISNIVNASADSFYSSQGRLTSFPDHNEGLMDYLVSKDIATLEMETFHLFHLAASWKPRKAGFKSIPGPLLTSPPTQTVQENSPLVSITTTALDSQQGQCSIDENLPQFGDTDSTARIRAASVQMIFAERTSKTFIVPEEVKKLEAACSQTLLESLSTFEILDSLVHPRIGSVWNGVASA